MVDSRNHRIQVFSREGEFITKWGSEGSGAKQFLHPSGIGTDSEGNVFVADLENHRVQKFTSNGNYITEWGAFGSLPGNFNLPRDVAVATDGAVYVADCNNNRVQVFKKTEETLRVDKAVIVAGGGPFPGNKIWDATQRCAGNAYFALEAQGFEKETIYYLSADRDLDLDGNGLADDVDANATSGDLQQALTVWAKDAQNLVLYMVDHGLDGSFMLSGTENLDVLDLATWLDVIQQHIPGKIIVVYDACQSGSFLPLLSSAGSGKRVIITGASAAETAYVDKHISFSAYFWDEIQHGQNIGDAFEESRRSLPDSYFTQSQHPLLDANGNGTPNEDSDISSAKGLKIGGGNRQTGSTPSIQSVSQEQTLSGQGDALLWVEDITASSFITDVWAVITPPDYESGPPDIPITDLPTQALFLNSEGRYEGTYKNFKAAGEYQIAIYALDQRGYISSPKFTRIRQTVGHVSVPANGIWKSADGGSLFLQKYDGGSCIVVVTWDGVDLTAFHDLDVNNGIDVTDDIGGQGFGLRLTLDDSTHGTMRLSSPKGLRESAIQLGFKDSRSTSNATPIPANGIWKSSGDSPLASFYLQKYEQGGCVLVFTRDGKSFIAFQDNNVNDGINVLDDVGGKGNEMMFIPYDVSHGRLELTMHSGAIVSDVELVFADTE